MRTLPSLDSYLKIQNENTWSSFNIELRKKFQCFFVKPVFSTFEFKGTKMNSDFFAQKAQKPKRLC